jgi:hypothetical protein
MEIPVQYKCAELLGCGARIRGESEKQAALPTPHRGEYRQPGSGHSSLDRVAKGQNGGDLRARQ